MPDRHSDEADAHVISKINANVTKLVGEIFGPRWGLRVGMILPALFAALFLYGGFTAHKHSQRLDFLIIGIF